MNPEIRNSRYILAAFAALAAIAVYLNTLSNGFALDDVFIVEMNNRAHDPTDIGRIWLTPYWPFYGRELGLYRPATIFLFALQWAAGGGAAWVFHATNIALHALVTVLVFLLVDRLTGRTAALVGALVFAVHPVHTEAVANIVGQAEIVSAAAMLAACLVHVDRPEGVAIPWPRRLLLLAFYLIAITAKESAVVLPALLVLLDFVQHRVRLSLRGLADYADAVLMPLLLMAAVLTAYLVVRFDVLGGSITGIDAAPAMPYLREEYRVLNALRAFPELLRLLFFPQELSSDYTPAVIFPVDDVRPMVVLGAVLLLAVTALSLATPWLPGLGFPAAWFLITIITVSNLFFPIGVLVAERTLYLPSVAVSALIAFAWRAAATRASPAARRLLPGAAVVVIALLAVRTWVRNPDWKDTETVWNAVYRDHPHSYRAQWVRAALMMERGRRDLAAAHYDLAYRIYSRDAQFNAQYANFLIGQGRYEEAIPMAEDAHRVHPSIPTPGLILAFGYVAIGRYEDALARIRAIETLPDVNLATAMALRGYALRGLGRHAEAAGAFAVALHHSTDADWRTHAMLARAYARAGHPQRAAAPLDSARALTTDSAASATLDRLQQVIAEGCYQRGSAPDAPAGFAQPERPACDPLGEWFLFAPPAQNATPLQNATEGVGTSGPESSLDVPE